jgi:hypothetical protein
VPPESTRTEITPLPLAVIQALPFVVVFGAPSDGHELAMFDVGSWLTEPTGKRRPVSLMLPPVEVHDSGVKPIAYSDLPMV